MCLLRVPWDQPEVTSDIFGHLLHFTQLNKGERRLVMDIDRTIERMDKENRDTVKKLSALYKETQDLKYVRAILCILKEFDDDPPKEKDLVKKLTR